MFEYVCRACDHAFERLVRAGDTPACPACQSQDLEKQLSMPALSSEGIRETNLARGRKAAEKNRKGHQEAQRDSLRSHLAEHH
jgi:putative FmdB family regulatory protein